MRLQKAVTIIVFVCFLLVELNSGDDKGKSTTKGAAYVNETTAPPAIPPMDWNNSMTVQCEPGGPKVLNKLKRDFNVFIWKSGLNGNIMSFLNQLACTIDTHHRIKLYNMSNMPSIEMLCERFTNATIEKVYMPAVLALQDYQYEFPPCKEFSRQSNVVQINFTSIRKVMRGYLHTARSDYLFGCGDMKDDGIACSDNNIISAMEVIQFGVRLPSTAFKFDQHAGDFVDRTASIITGIIIVGIVVILIIITATGVVLLQMKRTQQANKEEMRLVQVMLVPKGTE